MNKSNHQHNLKLRNIIMKNKAIKAITTMEGLLSVLVLIITLSSFSNNSHPVNKANSVYFVSAFHVPSLSTSTSTSLWNKNQQQRRRQLTQFRAGNKDDNDGKMSGPGMDNAFRELEALQSLEDGMLERPTEKPKEKDEIFTKAMDDLDLKDILSTVAEEDVDPPPESEIELYKDMASEVDAASSEEKLIVADFKSDLLLADDGDDEIDIDNNNDGVPTLDTDKFMDKAIEEALKEAKEKNSDVESTIGDKESFLDNKEIMSEIEKIFDKANEELLEGLEEIRSEQTLLARENAERNAKTSRERVKEDEQRFEIAQGNMKKMLSRVNEETKNVETAIEDLRLAQEESEGGLDTQLVGLKSGGLIKQSTLVGAILFTFRSGTETIGFLGGDPAHAVPALIQGVLAIICIVGFIFL